jgi:transglutaminase-like putative cysteine protease
MRIQIEHLTHYRYAGSARYCVQSLRLTPASYDGHTVLDWKISVEPGGHVTTSRDGFGNAINLATVATPHKEILIRATGTVEVENRNGIVAGLPEAVPNRVYLRRTDLTAPNPSIRALVHETGDLAPIPKLHALMGNIRERVNYKTGTTTAATTAAAALASGVGVCQDHAHIFIAAAREAGIPARYVTGYLLLDTADPADAHHAWAEAWVDGLGWIGFDVANCICPTERYVRMASAPDARYAAPVRGSRRSGDTEKLDVQVSVKGEATQQTQSQQ